MGLGLGSGGPLPGLFLGQSFPARDTDHGEIRVPLLCTRPQEHRGLSRALSRTAGPAHLCLAWSRRVATRAKVAVVCKVLEIQGQTGPCPDSSGDCKLPEGRDQI